MTFTSDNAAYAYLWDALDHLQDSLTEGEFEQLLNEIKDAYSWAF